MEMKSVYESDNGATLSRPAAKTPGARIEMKPVHYIQWQIGPGGIELSIVHYINYLSEQRKLYAYSLRKADRRIYDESRITITEGNKGGWRLYMDYFKYCRKYRKDIFHMHNGGPVILLLTLLAGVRNPLYHIHGTIYWHNFVQKLYLKPIWVFIRGLLLWQKATFIANSNYSAGIFKDKALPVQPTVVYNGLEVQNFLKKKSLRTGLRRMAYIGRLYTGKNVDLIIRLFEEIAGDYPELELHLAGTGSLQGELEAQAQKSPYAERIKFLGYVKDIASFYGSVDLFVFLSAYESFGNVVAEALLTGLPTLTSNIPVFEEIYGNEKDFILGDPADYEAVKQKFLKGIEDFPNLAQKAYALSASVETQCSIENHLRQIENIYEKH